MWLFTVIKNEVIKIIKGQAYVKTRNYYRILMINKTNQTIGITSTSTFTL